MILAEAVKSDPAAALARVQVLRGIIAERRTELAQAWEGPGFSRTKVQQIRSSIDNARHEILAIRRSWGFAKFLNEEVNEVPPPGTPAAAFPPDAPFESAATCVGESSDVTIDDSTPDLATKKKRRRA